MGPFLHVEECLCVPGHEDTGDTGAGVELPLPVPSQSGLCAAQGSQASLQVALYSERAGWLFSSSFLEVYLDRFPYHLPCE